MQYANSVMPEVTIGDTTYQIKLEIADNESSNEKAVSAANALPGPTVAFGSLYMAGTVRELFQKA